MLLLQQIRNIKLKFIQKFKNLRGLYFRPVDFVAFIYPCNCVHSLFFSKEIDIAFVNRKNIVIDIKKNFAPWRFTFCKQAYYVVEKFSSNKISFYNVGDFVDIGKEVNYENLSSL